METPMSVKVIPQQVLRDQQAVRIDKALENVSGVYQQPSSLGDISFFSIRGFGGYDGNSSFLYRNGVRASYAGADASFPDMANIERVEVLKGPASILYGRVEPGGMVNLVTKQPLDTPYYSLQQQVGSYDFYRTSTDATGSITKNGALAYRLNVAYENKGSFQDFASSNRVFVAPVIRWNISDKTTASLWLDYTKANDSILDTIPALGNRPASIPRSRSFGDPNNGQMQTEEQRFGFNWTHAFNNNWKFRHVFDARRNENNLTPNLGNNGIVDQANCTPQDCPVARYGQAFRGQPRHSEGYFNSLDLTGHFDTLGVKHTLLIGGAIGILPLMLLAMSWSPFIMVKFRISIYIILSITAFRIHFFRQHQDTISPTALRIGRVFMLRIKLNSLITSIYWVVCVMTMQAQAQML